MKTLYSEPHSFGVLVNPGNAVPLRPARLGVAAIILTAGIGNGGIIYVGGTECDLTNGQELDPGKGILLTPSSDFAYLEMMEAALGSGLNFNTLGAYRQKQGPNVLLPLNSIYVTSSMAAQQLRCLYFLPVTI